VTARSRTAKVDRATLPLFYVSLLLALLKRAGARFREEPIDWSDPGDSKVVPGLDALRMAAGLWRLRRRMG